MEVREAEAPRPAPHRSNCTAQDVLAKPYGVYLCQEDDTFAIWPDDMVHLRTDSLPSQLRSAEAGLKGRQHSEGPWEAEGTGPASRRHTRRLTTSISVLEWPMLHTMQLFFMRSRCSRVTTFLFPERKWGAEESGAGQLSGRTWTGGPPARWSMDTLCAKKRVLRVTALRAVLPGCKVELHKKPSGKRALFWKTSEGSDSLL